jgi:hypothetical protein
MDLSDDDLQRRAEADRREVDPPIEVQAAFSSPGGELDWWVRERREWWVIGRSLPHRRSRMEDSVECTGELEPGDDTNPLRF